MAARTATAITCGSKSARNSPVPWKWVSISGDRGHRGIVEPLAEDPAPVGGAGVEGDLDGRRHMVAVLAMNARLDSMKARSIPAPVCSASILGRMYSLALAISS